eukprot:1065522-Prorocentrum_minimum.AAC.2
MYEIVPNSNLTAYDILVELARLLEGWCSSNRTTFSRNTPFPKSIVTRRVLEQSIEQKGNSIKRFGGHASSTQRTPVDATNPMSS